MLIGAKFVDVLIMKAEIKIRFKLEQPDTIFRDEFVYLL